MATEQKTVDIFTDGSCLGNPGPGGWAALLRHGATEKRISGGFALTTNNRMEILAAIIALESLRYPCRVNIFSDSRYLNDSVSKKWIYGWLRKNWKKSDGKPVLNRDLWERLLPLLARHEITWNWVHGHSGHKENEEMDDLAKKAACGVGLPVDSGFRPDGG